MSRLTFLYGLGDVASRYGVDESIFLHVIVSLAINNKDNNRNFRDGRWWTYNSLAAWESEFSWWSTKQIRRIISSCREQGAIIVGEYNKDPRDRTAWYSPSDELLTFYRENWEGKCKCQNGQMHTPELETGCAQKGTTIPKESPNESTKVTTCLSEFQEIFSELVVKDDDRAATMAVMAELEKHGYICQNEVPVPSRGDAPKYTGRVGIVATKHGCTVAIEVDRRSIREKTMFKLREYSCDVRVVLLRGGVCENPPAGINAVFSLKLEDLDDLFHTFWDAYPKKTDKRRSYEVFKKLKVTPELLTTMLQALETQKRSEQWRKAKGQYIPYASTWLNGRRWEDEDKPARPAQTAAPAGERRVVEQEEVPTW